MRWQPAEIVMRFATLTSSGCARSLELHGERVDDLLHPLRIKLCIGPQGCARVLVAQMCSYYHGVSTCCDQYRCARMSHGMVSEQNKVPVTQSLGTDPPQFAEHAFGPGVSPHRPPAVARLSERLR